MDKVIGMKFSRTNTAVYALIAVVVIAAVYLVASSLMNPAYSLTVGMTAYIPSTVYPFNTTVFKVNVTNTGSSEIKNMPLGFYVNNNETHFYNVTVPIHESATVNITYSFGNPGNYTFKAVADPGLINKISDRQHAAASVPNVHVTVPESPNFYTAMPNGTTVSNNFYAFSQRGLEDSIVLASSFGLGGVTGMFTNSMYVGELASIINDVEGATVTYNNGTSINSMWMQGSVSPFWVNYSLHAYKIAANSIKFGNSTLYYYGSNGIATCAFYQKGWTRLLEYNGIGNESAQQACSTVNATYKNTFNTSLVAALNASHVYNYTSTLIYKNSTGLGELASAGPDNSISLANFYQNNAGTFISVVTKHKTLDINNLNLSCTGVVYSSNSLNACSSIILPASNSVASSYDMLNTTEIMPNYTFTLYSVVNNTYLLSAHYSAIALFNASNTVGPSAAWSSAFKNTCSTGSNSIGCSVSSFNFTTNTASISLKNDRSLPITINSVKCAMYINGTAESVNETIAPHTSGNITTTCTTIPVSLVSAFDVYNLTTMYTYNGTAGELHGNMSITNFFQG